MSAFLGGAHDSDIVCDITNYRKRMQTTTNRRTLQQLTFARGGGVSILLICSMWIQAVLEDALALACLQYVSNNSKDPDCQDTKYTPHFIYRFSFIMQIS